MTGPQGGERLWLIDANSVVHRLYHAIPSAKAPATGQEINAVVGFVVLGFVAAGVLL